MPQLSTSKGRFNEVVEFVSRGEFEHAEGLCRALLQKFPRDVNIVGMRGAVLIKLRRYEDAEQSLRQAIKLAPTFAKPHEDLGFVLLELKRPREAADVLRNAVRLDPHLEQGWLNLGKALAMLGLGKEADEAFEKSFALNPERGKLALAAEHHKEGRFEEAERLYRELIRANPKNVDAIRLLGRVALSAKRNDDAERLFRRAIRLAPDFTGAIADLARLLKEQNRFDEAIECCERLIELEPESPQAHFQLGGTLAPAALTYRAIEAYRKALELSPKFPGARLGLGHVLKTVGRQEEAIEAYRECIRLRPDNGESYWSLANLKTYRLSDEDIAEMKKHLEQDDLPHQSRVNFLFAMAKALEDRGEFERAWEYYVEGNGIQRMEEKYDPIGTEVMNDAIIEVFDSEFLDKNPGLGNPDPSPIFVIGLPRSGSTLIEQILASHSQVEGTAELPDIIAISRRLGEKSRKNPASKYPEVLKTLTPEAARELGEGYLASTRVQRSGKPFFIDKMPNNFQHIGLIHLVLPKAKIVDARRHPMAGCFSCYKQLFARGQTFTYDLDKLGRYYRDYVILMDHWDAVLPGRVHRVQYEEMVENTEVEIRRLLAYCGLEFEQACLRFFETERAIRTPSAEQVRQPVYREGLEHWRHFEKHLDPLKQALGRAILDRYAA